MAGVALDVEEVDVVEARNAVHLRARAATKTSPTRPFNKTGRSSHAPKVGARTFFIVVLPSVGLHTPSPVMHKAQESAESAKQVPL